MYNDSLVCLSDGSEHTFLPANEILYLTSDGNYSKVLLKNGSSYSTTKKLKELERLLPDRSFLRVHNSYIVNLAEVVRFNSEANNELEMSNGDLLKVSRRKKSIFIGKYIKI